MQGQEFSSDRAALLLTTGGRDLFVTITSSFFPDMKHKR